MPDKVTIDFEKELVTWETNIQKGTDSCPGISTRKNQIIAAMGYASVDFTPVVNAFNDLGNGKINKDEFLSYINDFSNDEKKEK